MKAFDGCVELAVGDARRIRLIHVLSGLDQHFGEAGDGAWVSAITGYTEWVSRSLPRITMGWDWEMVVVGGAATLRRLSAPRTNLLLVPPDGSDLVLGARVDAFDWQSTTLRHLTMHFSK